jgi:putative membrane-bound dehydrogenase-like protein
MMRARIALLCLLIPLGHAVPARPAAEPDGPFVVADGLEVTLWAESPMFFNPTNIDVDARGRVWVAEAVNYRSFNTAKLDPLAHPEGDRIVILEDTNHDGRADSAQVFVQDADLRAPLGLAVVGNRVIVSASPHLVVYTDENGDDTPDRKEILLTGFGGYDHDHGLHALTAGPDGRWYFNAGNAGPHVVTDRTGWTLRSGSLYTGGSPYNLDNQGGMVSDDGRIWVGGVALRVNPDGTGLTVLSHNFRNAYELAVDSFGDLWQNDNDDQVMTCRTTWLMEGSNAGYFSADGTRYWQADRRPGQDSFTAHWHQDDPGVLPAGDNTGAGAPAGIVRYESDLLGPRYRGLLLSADAGRNVIFGYLPRSEGAGFALDRFDVLSSLAEPDENYIWNRVDGDRRKWFRPSDVAIGPDGAIYVADWYDPIVGGHQMHDRRGYGRIYRITPKGRTLTTPRLDLESIDGQIQALLSPAVNVRSIGFDRLKARGEAARTAVRRVLNDSNPFHRARAVWLLVALGPAGVADVERLLADGDPQIRITAFRALRQARQDVLAESRRLASDPSPAVRREVALALRDVPFDRSGDLLMALAAGFDGQDRWYLEALGIGASGKEATLYAALTSSTDRAHPLAWDESMAALAWRLHPPAAVDAFAARAGSADLSPAARAQALVGLGFVDHPRAARAMADLTGSPLRDVATAAAWWLTYRRSNDWREYPVEGWAVAVTEARAVPRDELMAHRALVVDGGAPIDRRIEATLALAETGPGGRLLMALVAENRLVYQLREAAGSLIFMNPDRSVRAAASGYFQPPGGQVPMRVEAVTGLAGDPARGAAQFQGACATCHRHGETGADVGPDLTAIHTKFDRGGLIEAIVQPNAAIAFGFAAEVFVTDDQHDPQIGFLQADGPTVTIRDGYGRMISFDRDRVARRLPLESSLMPEPLGLGLTAQDVADVVAYLMR